MLSKQMGNTFTPTSTNGGPAGGRSLCEHFADNPVEWHRQPFMSPYDTNLPRLLIFT
jgi:hypothetical protein